MRILYFSHQSDYLYGAEICTLELMQQARSQHEVWFAAPKGKYLERASKIARTAVVPSVEFKRAFRYILPFFFAYIRTLLSLILLIHKQKISLIHATTLKSMVYVWPLSFFGDLKIVWHHHDILPKNLGNAFWVRALARAANKIIVPSKATKIGLEVLGVPTDKIFVIANGFSFSDWQEQEKEITKKFHIGFIGEISRRKGVDWLEKIVSLVEEKIPGNCKFVIVGAALSDPAFAEKVTQSNARWVEKKVVEFLGRRENIKEILRTFSCLIVPSRQDPLPTVIIEAGFSRIPCIATPVGGIPEMIFDGSNGYLCRTPHEFAEKIIFLVRNPDLCNEMGLKARSIVEEKFSAEKMWSSVESVYKDIFSVSAY